jgi:signal transduction histidine kinase
MTPRSLQVLLVAGDDGAADRLAALLGACSRPAMEVTRAASVDEASLIAGSRDVDVVVIDARLVPDLDRGMLRLPSILLGVPVVLSVDEAWTGPPPEGVADYLVPDRDPAHVVERLLTLASQRHAMLRTLREAESQLRAIVEGISDGVMILGERDEVLYANPAVESILQIPLAAILGAPSPIAVRDESASVIEHDDGAGPTRILRVSSIPILWERRQARLATFQDITAERAIQDSLRRARDEAERVAGLKTSFLANMSHELRMPLASMVGFAQIIHEGSDNKEHREFAGSIIESGNRLLETITSILDLTRLDADAVSTETRPVSVAAIAREAVGMLSALASRKDLKLEVAEPRLDDTVNTDPSILRRILANLIGNAIKFTDRGGVTVRVEADDAFVRTHVTDTGRGISAEFVPRLFDEFTQESSGFGRSHEGSGLGLAITRRLCDVIGAEIGVESTPGEGSTFTVTIPHHSAWTN